MSRKLRSKPHGNKRDEVQDTVLKDLIFYFSDFFVLPDLPVPQKKSPPRTEINKGCLWKVSTRQASLHVTDALPTTKPMSSRILMPITSSLRQADLPRFSSAFFFTLFSVDREQKRCDGEAKSSGESEHRIVEGLASLQVVFLFSDGYNHGCHPTR